MFLLLPLYSLHTALADFAKTPGWLLHPAASHLAWPQTAPWAGLAGSLASFPCAPQVNLCIPATLPLALLSRQAQCCHLCSWLCTLLTHPGIPLPTWPTQLTVSSEPYSRVTSRSPSLISSSNKSVPLIPSVIACITALIKWHSCFLAHGGWPVHTCWIELGLSLKSSEKEGCESAVLGIPMAFSQPGVNRPFKKKLSTSTITICTNINSQATNPGKILKLAWAREQSWRERKGWRTSLHDWKELFLCLHLK